MNSSDNIYIYACAPFRSSNAPSLSSSSRSSPSTTKEPYGVPAGGGSRSGEGGGGSGGGWMGFHLSDLAWHARDLATRYMCVCVCVCVCVCACVCV